MKTMTPSPTELTANKIRLNSNPFSLQGNAYGKRKFVSIEDYAKLKQELASANQTIVDYKLQDEGRCPCDKYRNQIMGLQQQLTNKNEAIIEMGDELAEKDKQIDIWKDRMNMKLSECNGCRFDCENKIPNAKVQERINETKKYMNKIQSKEIRACVWLVISSFEELLSAGEKEQ